MKFATPYNARKRETDFATHITAESMTVQADAKDLDINVIMSRYSQTGQLPRINSAQPQYGDFTTVGDYRQCLDTVRAAQETFQQLPATVRKRFANDPALFLEFAQDEKNLPELEKMGLTKPKEPPYSADAAAIITALQSKETENGGENTPDAARHRDEPSRPRGKGRS